MPLHDAALDALGDPNRRAILEILGDGERSVAEIAGSMPISRPAVSRHLRILNAAGLVADRAEGTRRLYGLRADGAAAVRRFLADVWGDAMARYRIAVENTEPRP
jgi:DNA-binding transcriptional ArsR family regulator